MFFVIRIYPRNLASRSKGGEGSKVSSDKELAGWWKVTEGGREEGCEWRDQIRGCGDFLSRCASKNEDQVMVIKGQMGLILDSRVARCSESGV